MKSIGRKIYYDLTIGEVIVNTGERKGSVIPTTKEQDIATFKALSERNLETFGVIELEYGQYGQDFRESSSCRVNPETKELEFSYRDSAEPQTEMVYQKPLSEEINDLKHSQSEQDDIIMDFLIGGL